MRRHFHGRMWSILSLFHDTWSFWNYPCFSVLVCFSLSEPQQNQYRPSWIWFLLQKGCFSKWKWRIDLTSCSTLCELLRIHGSRQGCVSWCVLCCRGFWVWVLDTAMDRTTLLVLRWYSWDNPVVLVCCSSVLDIRPCYFPANFTKVPVAQRLFWHVNI